MCTFRDASSHDCMTATAFHAMLAVTGLASIPLVTYVDLFQRFDSRGFAETLEVGVMAMAFCDEIPA